ncbi:MAG: AAA family ATPase [Alphaproteobacteria bacterium]|nr:AAA family ATPase [Alphaproteobacteria bacterium]MDD9919227.1 AAA family ATPase [Alphaproteobacteria bacterium]
MRKYLNWKFIIPIALVLGVVGYFGSELLYDSSEKPKEKPTLNQLQEAIKSPDLKLVKLYLVSEYESRMTLIKKSGQEDTFYLPSTIAEKHIEKLVEKDIPVRISQGLTAGKVLSALLSLAIIGFVLFIVMLAIFSHERKRKLKPAKSRITFDAVAGVDEVRGELEQIVEFVKKGGKAGLGKIPKGALLVGPPGTGKTLLAKAVAGEAGVPFFFASGSEFDEKYVGVGASRIRDLFEGAKKSRRAIIFIDEIDALGRKRSNGDNQTLNQLLIEMDGFEGNHGIIVIAATNRVEDLDPALRRPGRFDRVIEVPLPDLRGRAEVLKVTVASRNIPLSKGVDLSIIARGTTGFSGAQLANLVNEAALAASANDRNEVTMVDFDQAREKLIMGLCRPQVVSEGEKGTASKHEAGHALVALRHHGVVDPIYKATIIPRGGSLGMVVMLPEEDELMVSFKKLQAMLEVMLAGRIAEKVLIGEDDITTGAADDLQKVTALANRMVTEWGFCAGGGVSCNLAYRQRTDVNGDLGRMHPVSVATLNSIDQQVQKLVDEAAKNVEKLFEVNKELLAQLANDLLEKETLTGKELRQKFLPKIKVAEAA